MDGILLAAVAREITEKLLGARVDRVSQPEKDELHLTLRGREGTHRLLLCASAMSARAHLTGIAKPNPMDAPMFCMLLRKLLGGARLAQVAQPGGDRLLELTFDCLDDLGESTQRVLSCEIMGRHSNIILRNSDGIILDSIRHVGADVSRVREVKPGLPYAPPPAQDKLSPADATAAQLAAALEAAPARLDKALSQVLAGVGMGTAQELCYRLTAQASPLLDAPARMALAAPLCDLLAALPNMSPPTLLLDEAFEPRDVLPFPARSLPDDRQRPVPEGPGAALDLCYAARDRRERMAQKSASLAKSLRTHIERCEKRLQVHEETLLTAPQVEEARITGELLTANLHRIPRGAALVEVPDYYTGGARAVALDTRLTPAQNAQKYYKQYQKMKAARAHAIEQAEQARQELAQLFTWQDDLRKCEAVAELDEIRAEMVRAGYLRASHRRGKPQKPAPSKPMLFTSPDGLTVRVGRNSAQNDRLTTAAPPDALWLHAKDMPGSHVLIEATGEVPEATLRFAANLAAWFSRGYQSAQVPIDYTRRKYVKKPAGAAPGAVIYTHQRTVFVRPEEPKDGG
ncbi:MAG: NFACT RNA binding domain-containing protein [Oscillospiraceae bacterium]|jgi:predicted ribosome quality control (RQC) complex YloA/Tae2 family protein|nr:NFACT RNA binding domain-containing protein [Oscillospiraceae bacterium]